MWGNPKGITENDIERRLSLGFGQGIGIGYIPWVQKHDFGSLGTAKEIFGIKIPRSHHLLSQLEYRVFLPFERLKSVIDIREQFPLLDRDLIVRITKKMNCRCPRYLGTRTVYVMTTDLLLTLATPSGPRLLACSIKLANHLKRRRVRELLEIERRYWKEFGVEWCLITEKEVNLNVWRNLRWLRQRAILDRDLSYPGLNQAFLNELASAHRDDSPFRDVINKIANSIGIPPEITVALFKYNTWHGMVQTNLFERIELTSPIKTIKICPDLGGSDVLSC